MLTCVLNAAEGQLNIVLGNSEGIICAQNWTTSAKSQLKGAEILTPALNFVLSLGKYKPHDVERFACVYGPGSFTGIRLVLGTVSAIRRITRAQNASIDFLQAIALDAQNFAQNICECRSEEGQIWVLTHARRDIVHCQSFSMDSMPRPLTEAKLSTTAEVIKYLQAAPANSLVLGSGFVRNKDIFAPALPDTMQAFEYENPSAEALWKLATEAQYHNNDIEPLYIRPCDAVENLDYIAKKQGVEPAYAHARLDELLKQSNF